MANGPERTAPPAPLGDAIFTVTLPVLGRLLLPWRRKTRQGKGREPVYVTAKGVGKVRFPPLLSYFFINLIFNTSIELFKENKFSICIKRMQCSVSK
jgi:hypothetical protein